MQAHPVLDPQIPLSAYRKVDLSIDNPILRQASLDASGCQSYLRDFLGETNGQVGWGGYLEQRDLYRGFDHFSPQAQEPREYHLGVDFWADTGTSVHAPWDGTLHSWANQAAPGDYGPVILMAHQFQDRQVVSLFGHLSESSLHGLYEGKAFRRGDLIR